MTTPAYAAVDWGTSSFRLWLMDPAGRILAERRSGEGMTSAAKMGFPQVLESHLQAVEAPADLPVIICGMAGARQGWTEAGYVDVPALLPAVLSGAVEVPESNRRVHILPGLAQGAPEAPDVMRGEETQLLGAIGGSAPSGEQNVCMPGTHSKWVHLSGETVSGFSTYMTGELFEVASKHSVLAHSLADARSFDGDHPVFTAAVRAAFKAPQRLTNLLFTVRSGMLLAGLTATDAAARLSGVLIGAEIAGGLSSSGSQAASIRLVASGRLQGLYEGAFAAVSLPFTTIDADEAVRAGLSAAARQILPPQLQRTP